MPVIKLKTNEEATYHLLFLLLFLRVLLLTLHVASIIYILSR